MQQILRYRSQNTSTPCKQFFCSHLNIWYFVLSLPKPPQFCVACFQLVIYILLSIFHSIPFQFYSTIHEFLEVVSDKKHASFSARLIDVQLDSGPETMAATSAHSDLDLASILWPSSRCFWDSCLVGISYFFFHSINSTVHINLSSNILQYNSSSRSPFILLKY